MSQNFAANVEMQQTMQKILPPAPAPPPPPHHRRVTFPAPPANVQAKTNDSNEPTSEDDKNTKRILKETVDTVVNTFAKHTREFGRGEFYLFETFCGQGRGLGANLSSS